MSNAIGVERNYAKMKARKMVGGFDNASDDEINTYLRQISNDRRNEILNESSGNHAGRKEVTNATGTESKRNIPSSSEMRSNHNNPKEANI